MTSLDFLLENALKGTVILAVAFAAQQGLRHASAARRHFVWMAAFGALLLLPLAILLAGRASRPVLALPDVPVAYTVTAVQAVGQAPPRNLPIIAWPLLLWILGCGVAASRFLLGAARAWWIVRHATKAAHAAPMLAEVESVLGMRRPVRVLASPATSMPFIWGISCGVVLLPADAHGWRAARLKTVLLHELLHIQRRDLLAQTISQAACCLFWFHPLAWLAARRLRREREQACDDAVLLRGIAAQDYAGHLVDQARALSERRNRLADAPAMAESSDLESRIRALLDRRRNRQPMTRGATLAVTALASLLLLPVAAITAHAQAARGVLAGVVEDASGARVPRCEVLARNLDGANQEVTRANNAGEYRFAAIPPGRYGLEFRAPGFAAAKKEVVVTAGAVARLDAMIEIGSVNESLVITGRKPATAEPPAAGAPQRIRVGGNVQATKLISMVRPAYPADLQQLGIQGTAVIRAVISKDGAVLNPEVLSTGIDSRLATAALEAVRQWRYQPTLLNGQPVEVVTTITVDFRLEQ